MKSTILTFLLLVTVVFAKAQFTYRVVNKFASGPSSSFELICKGYVKNTGTVNATFVWRLDKSLVATGWGSTICDNNLCYDTSVYSAAFDLTPGDSGIANVYVYPKMIGGTGSVGLTIYKLGDSSNSVKETLTFSAWTLGVEDVSKDNAILYPNPANSWLQINLEIGSPVQMGIFNVLGQLQQTFTHSKSNSLVNIETLPAGVYILKYIDETGHSVSKQFHKL